MPRLSVWRRAHGAATGWRRPTAVCSRSGTHRSWVRSVGILRTTPYGDCGRPRKESGYWIVDWGGQVYRFGRSAASGRWRTRSPPSPSRHSEHARPGMGYWLLAPEDFAYTLRASPVAPVRPQWRRNRVAWRPARWEGTPTCRRDRSVIPTVRARSGAPCSPRGRGSSRRRDPELPVRRGHVRLGGNAGLDLSPGALPTR